MLSHFIKIHDGDGYSREVRLHRSEINDSRCATGREGDRFELLSEPVVSPAIFDGRLCG